MYVLARGIAQVIVATFFGEVHTVGLERIPASGPVIFVSNHSNKFVDASVVMACIPRSLRFLIATVSLSVPVVGRLAKFAGAIGVNRAQDMKYMGIGRIVGLEVIPGQDFTPASPASAAPGEVFEQYQARGNELTRFRLDCKKHDKLSIQGEMYCVEKVIDDHLLILSKTRGTSAVSTNVSSPASPSRSPSPPESETSTNETLESITSNSSWPFTIYPKVDQGEVYESVCRALYEGNSICLFPEGGSHDQPGLLPLKPGVAVMALNSALLGVEDVLIVPVGIHYFDRVKFGSEAVVEIGQPLALAEDLVQMYADGNKKKAVKILMDQVKERLEDCLIYATSYEKIRVIELCASLYPPDKLQVSLEKHHRLQALFTQLLNRFEEESQTLAQDVLEYGRLLEANGLRDSDVTNIVSLNAELATLKMLEKVIPLVLLSIVVLPALAITFPIRWISTIMTERHRSSALAQSAVKLQANDVVASYKIVWCICILPILYTLIAVLVAFKYPVPIGFKMLRHLISLLLCLVAQPLLTYWGLRLRNKLPSYMKQIRCYYRVLISELDVWRGGEREVIIDRIDLQLRVREFVKEIEAKDVDVFTSAKNRMKVFLELEDLIPSVVIDTDTRRLKRQKDKLMPVVYRSAVMSREEIL